MGTGGSRAIGAICQLNEELLNLAIGSFHHIGKWFELDAGGSCSRIRCGRFLPRVLDHLTANQRDFFSTQEKKRKNGGNLHDDFVIFYFFVF